MTNDLVSDLASNSKLDSLGERLTQRCSMYFLTRGIHFQPSAPGPDGEVRGVLSAASPRSAAPGAEAAAEADVSADVAGGWGPAGAPAQQHAAQPHGEVPQQVRTRPERSKLFPRQTDHEAGVL